MPARLGESGAQLVERSNKGQVHRVTWQAVTRDREARHMLMPDDHEPHPDDVGQDHIGRDSIGGREREDRRHLIVDPLKDIDN